MDPKSLLSIFFRKLNDHFVSDYHSFLEKYSINSSAKNIFVDKCLKLESVDMATDFIMVKSLYDTILSVYSLLYSAGVCPDSFLCNELLFILEP